MIDGSRIFPEKAAIGFGDETISYRELDRLSAGAAALLEEAGVTRGDRVALYLGNVPAFAIWYYGALRIGAIAVSVNTRLTGEEAAFILDDSGSAVFVVPEGTEEVGFAGRTIAVSLDGRTVDGEALVASAEEMPGFLELDPGDPGVILYTSGTTGFPKGATLSHGNIRATVHAFNHLCGMTPEDRLLVFVPLFHCYGQNALLNAGLNTGATVVLQPRFDLVETRELIRRHGVTKLFGVPATFQMMLEVCEPAELESVGYCFSAAATLAPQTGARWQEKFGMPIYEGYGLTETAPFASYNHRVHHVPGSIGVPVDLVEMKIVDPETGEDCPPGVPGEIVVRGPNVMLGYWERPEETAEAVRDGWFHSGDVGTVDEKGYFYIVDRIKDMIAVGGMKVFPSEVERVLFDDPAVADCAVVGWPHDTWGEEVVAFIVAEGETGEEPVRARCLEHLASYKVPSRIVFVDELPRNPAGKVLKTKLRERGENPGGRDIDGSGERGVSGPAENHPGSAGPDTSVPGPLTAKLLQTHASGRKRLLTDYLQEEIRSLTGSEEPPAVETALLETGMDSVMMVNLGTRLQEQIGSQLEFPATLVFDYPRIDDLADFLLEAVEPTGRRNDGDSDGAARTETSAGGESDSSIDEMSEDEAMEALMEELKE